MHKFGKSTNWYLGQSSRKNCITVVNNNACTELCQITKMLKMHERSMTCQRDLQKNYKKLNNCLLFSCPAEYVLRESCIRKNFLFFQSQTNI